MYCSFGNVSINVTNITTAANVTADVRNEDLAKLEIIVQTFIFLLAVIGNSVVVLTLLIQRSDWARMHLLMLHLCFADLFVAFGSVLPQLLWDVTFVFKGGNILCKVVKYMQIVAIYASAYVLVMTAVDRYFAICHPFMSHQWSVSRVHRMVILAWSLSLIFSTPQLFIFSYELSSYGMYDCWGTFTPEWTLPLYITCFTALVYIIPTLILAFCYGSICIAVWKSGNLESTNSKDVKSKRRGITQAKLKTIKLTLAVVLIYLLCWSPFFIAQMWAVYDENAPFNGMYSTCNYIKRYGSQPGGGYSQFSCYIFSVSISTVDHQHIRHKKYLKVYTHPKLFPFCNDLNSLDEGLSIKMAK